MNDDLHALSGAYAVDALPYAEWTLFEEHLRGCAGCGTEVRRLRETAARLAGAVAVDPPAGLRTRLLAAARRSPSPHPAPPPPGDAPAARLPGSPAPSPTTPLTPPGEPEDTRGDGLGPSAAARPWAGKGRRGEGWGRGLPVRVVAGLALLPAHGPGEHARRPAHAA
ncbi:hypothetical protein ABZW49_44330, partial [Nonomuraea wenchangensis]